MNTAELRAKLNQIHDPCSVASGRPIGLEDMGLIDTAECDGAGVATVRLRLSSPSCLMIGFFVTTIKETLSSLPGIHEVIVTHDAGDVWEPEMMSQQIQAERAAAWQQKMQGLASRGTAAAAPHRP